jgi:hypothetical protein
VSIRRVTTIRLHLQFLIAAEKPNDVLIAVRCT